MEGEGMDWEDRPTQMTDVYVFGRKVKFYEDRERAKADRRILISLFVEPKAKTLALALGIEVYTRAEDMAFSKSSPDVVRRERNQPETGEAESL